MMRGPRGLIVTLLGAAAVIAAAFIFGLNGHKDEAETARLFMTHLAAGEVSEAHTLLQSSLATDFSADDLAGMFDGMAPYPHIRFPGITFSTVDGARLAELTGTGTTDGGCQSALDFDLLDGKIVRFDIRPLCRSPGS